MLKFRWRKPRGGDQVSSYLRESGALKNIVEQERMRSDRTGQPFVVVAIELMERAEVGEQIPVLARLLKNRLRATDTAGFVGPRQLGVVLPDTSLDGALKLVGDIHKLMAAEGLSPQFTLFFHPWSDLRETEARPSSNGNGRPQIPVQDLQTWFVEPLPRSKRLLDVLGSSLALIVLSPLMLAAALAVKVSSPGPAIFTQQRAGLGGKPFTIYKFRSMSLDAEGKKQKLMAQNEQDGPAFKLTYDPRVTRVGRIIRKTSIDELPQLFNVLKGDMSLVGPRPLPCSESDRCETWQKRRLCVTPGITGLWQVNGRRRESFPDWVRLDLDYARTRSVSNDIKLLLKTIPAVIFCRGAS